MNDAPDILWRRIRDADRRASADRPRLLVVDDDSDARLLMRYVLRRDVRTDVATTAAEALRMARATAYDGLLIGLRLPDDTGLRVMKRLRFRACYRSVPMVAVTDHLLEGDCERLLDAGFDACVSRSIQTEELPVLVQRLLDGDEDTDGPALPSGDGRAAEAPPAEPVPAEAASPSD